MAKRLTKTEDETTGLESGFLNPFSEGVSYEDFLQSIPEGVSLKDYCKDNLNESDFKWLETELDHYSNNNK